MKLSLLLSSLISLSFATLSLHASPWDVRIRGTYLEMGNRSDAFTALGTNFGADAVQVNSKWIPEVDLSYTFTEHFSAELVLTIPQTQDVHLAGAGKLGTFKHLPPVLTAQYRFAPLAALRPYVGLGANYTFIFDERLSVAAVPLELEKKSIGIAAQAGCNIAINKRWSLNVDAKYVTLSSDVSVQGGPRLTTAKLNPWLFSLGFGMRL